LLLLVGLRLSGVPLPDRRFEVYEAVVTQLLEDHPAARAAAARVAAEDGGLPADDVRQVLAHLAFQWQERGELTPVADSTVRADLVAALKDPGHLAMDAYSAARMARTLTEIAEGQLGVLVRYGHQDLGFLHRVFLEELAAEHAADQLPADDRRDLFARRADDPRWAQVLLGVLSRTRRPAENSALLQVIAGQASDSRPGSLTARELLAEAVFAGFRLPAADTARHALAVLDAIETHPHVTHRQRLLAASVAGLSSPAGRLLRERLPRWTLAPHPLPPGLFHHLGRAASDTELDEPLWPILVAALAMEDLGCASSAAIALADRYGATGDTQARDGVLRALRNAATASHAAIALACLALGWPSDPAAQEMATWGRRQAARPVRVTALAAALGVLRRALTTSSGEERPLPGAHPLSEDERTWLVSQLHSDEQMRPCQCSAARQRSSGCSPCSPCPATASRESGVAAMAATPAARDRARLMLARPQVPLATLVAGYARNAEALRPVLHRLHEAFPALPAQLRAYLCTLLRDIAADRPLARDLTRQWADDPDDQVAVAASAAFHAHLRHDHEGGTLPPGEWDAALAAIRRQAVKRKFLRWGHQRGAWAGALLLDRPSALDDATGGQDTARLNLGDTVGAADMTLLSTIADGWPALRAHFGDHLLSQLSDRWPFNRDNGITWNYLALVADREPLLSRELAQAVADQPALLDNDGVLAWYASTHRGDDNLTGILISRLDDGTNARTLASMLLADPRDLGLAPDAVQAQLRSLFDPDRLWYLPYQSGALEALSDGFPDDDLVQKFWDMIADARKHGEPVDMHPRTYYPLAYAAVPADGLLDQFARDTGRIADWGNTYFDTQFSRAIIRRLRRDASARAKIEAYILAAETADSQASCLAGLTAAAFPLSDGLTANLTTRLEQQLLLPAPDMAHDYVSGADIPVPVLLLQVLHSGI
jgi:hypothetical protein